jgi:GTP-binding protein HflX
VPIPNGIELYGNKTGLSPSAVRTLERLYRRRVPLESITTPELTRSLIDASVEAGRQVGVLVHRSGQVDYVIVGDAGKLMLPDIGRLRAAEGRFRGLRLVHTHLRGEPLTRDDLVDLVRLRLDLVAAIQLAPSGEPRGLTYAYNVPADEPGAMPYREVGPVPIGRVDINFGALMGDLEAEFARRSRAREVRAKDGRAILVHVSEKSKPGSVAHADESVRELRELARTAGTEVVDVVVQVRDRVDPKTVLGRGKLDDVVVRAMQLDAETLIFDRELTPAQASAIAKTSDLKVIDRTQLILDIFAQRAESRDGKLQVELAQLKYSLPRLGLKDDSLSRLTGGIGGRGPGETKLEIGKRRAKERVTHLETQLKELGKQREQRRRRRTRGRVPTVAIVGYTNAGKSTLLNTLTGAAVLAEDKLFATLDTRSRTLVLPDVWPHGVEDARAERHEDADVADAQAGADAPDVGDAANGTTAKGTLPARSIVLTDTVGFIRNLPKDLFAAFRATFEEAAGADLLLHVVDASDPAHDEHIRTTEQLLEELDLAEIPRLLVFNKADLLEPGEGELRIRGLRDAVLVSSTGDARDKASLDALLARMAEKLAPRFASTASHDAADTADRNGADPSGAPSDGGGTAEQVHATTLETMLRAGGKRSARVRRVTRVTAA